MTALSANETVLLDQMLADLDTADELYKPTNFWSSGLPSIVDDLRKQGMANFRSHPSARDFYAPAYASGSRAQQVTTSLLARAGRGHGLRKKIANEHVAEFDYRLFKGLDPAEGLDLASVSESTFGGPPEQFVFDGRRYSRSMLNYLRALVLFKRTVPDAQVRTVLEIGGGYGTLGEILLKADPSITFIDADIPPVAFVATCYLREVFGGERIADYSETRTRDTVDIDELAAAGRSAVLTSWQVPQLTGLLDLFANFISFQEMEPHVVRNYAKQVSALGPRYVLLRNQAEGKRIASQAGEVGVFEPVTHDTYVEAFADYDLLAADSTIFGDEAFGRSEVLVFERRA